MASLTFFKIKIEHLYLNVSLGWSLKTANTSEGEPWSVAAGNPVEFKQTASYQYIAGVELYFVLMPVGPETVQEELETSRDEGCS